MVNRFTSALLEGLFPHHCCLCGLRSHRDVPLCHGCEGDLSPNVHCCHRCAVPLATGPDGPRLCGSCLQSPPAFGRVVAPWRYSEHIAHLIHRWKYRGEVRLTPLLAHLWLREIPAPGAVDLLVPVPLHWRKLWHRGFNQSDLLCRQLYRARPAIASGGYRNDLVRRIRPTAAQSGMSAAERRRNLQGAFTTRGACATLRVAIVDDVLTTGATADAMARALRAAGASAVDVWCLARTPPPGD